VRETGGTKDWVHGRRTVIRNRRDLRHHGRPPSVPSFCAACNQNQEIYLSTAVHGSWIPFSVRLSNIQRGLATDLTIHRTPAVLGNLPPRSGPDLPVQATMCGRRSPGHWGFGTSQRIKFFFYSHIFIPVSGIIYNPVERAYPTLQALRTNAGLPIPGHMNAQGWDRYFIVLCRWDFIGSRSVLV